MLVKLDLLRRRLMVLLAKACRGLMISCLLQHDQEMFQVIPFVINTGLFITECLTQSVEFRNTKPVVLMNTAHQGLQR
jgi:hypothetical protein